jgi:hypothetical protein
MKSNSTAYFLNNREKNMPGEETTPLPGHFEYSRHQGILETCFFVKAGARFPRPKTGIKPVADYIQKITSYLYFSLILCIILNGRLLRLKSKKRRIKMKVIKKKLNLMVLCGIFILMLINMNAFSYIYHNGSGSGYEESGEIYSEDTYTIETLIISGAGYYLKSNSKIQKFLNLIELQDIIPIDYNEINRLMNLALENIAIARETYENLIILAESTPYKLEFIAKLKNFDYQSYMNEMGLNSVVFNKVREYLEKGDITGSFKHTYSNLCAIEELLTSIKNGTAVNQMPELSLLWKLNETCAESLLFGSYAARVFHIIQ